MPNDMVYLLKQLQRIKELLAASELECEQKTLYNLNLNIQIQELR